MSRPLIVALDFPGRTEVQNFLKHFKDQSLYVKVGMELYYKEGPSMLYELKEQGHQIFLDLKLHDIPNTVQSAMKILAALNVDLVNVHAAGGKRMMSAAIEGLEAGTSAGNKRPSCIAVTQLTSTSEEIMQKELLINRSLQDTAVQYAVNASESGLDGVVCSTWEVNQIAHACSHEFKTVTPGIRLKDNLANDQVRVATPEQARKEGSWAIVVGRSITRAADPLQAYNLVQSEWEGKK